MEQLLEMGCQDVYVTPWRQDARIRDAFSSMFEVAPHAFRKFRVASFVERFHRALVEEASDVVHFDVNMTEMFGYLTGREASVISPSDSFTKMMLRMTRFAPGVARRVYTLTQAAKFWYVERYFYPRFTKCHVVTEPEAEFLRRISPRSDLAVIPTGGDVPEHPREEQGREVQPDVVFSGQMNNPFTVDSALWFCRSVWPRIRARAPECRLWLVGANPTPRIRALAHTDESVVVTGFVPDMVQALQDKAVYVCPLTYGVGIRTRLFEPMAYGIPVVTTRMGAEGIEVVHGEHVLVADDPGAFAEAVTALLGQPELRARLARRAHELVKRRYTWEAYARGMERLYEEALRKRKADTDPRRVAWA